MPKASAEIKKSLRDQLPVVAKDLAIHGIFVNVDAIRQGIKDGKLQLKTVVAELLNLNEENVDALENGSLEGISKELEGLVSKVSKLCNGKDEPCGQFNILSIGISDIQSVDPTSVNGFEEVAKNDSSLHLLATVKKNSPGQLMKTVDDFKKIIGNPTKHNTIQVAFYLQSYTTDLIEGSKVLSVKFSQDQIKKLDLANLKKDFGGIVKAKPLFTLKGNNFGVDLMNKKLTSLENVISQAQSILSVEFSKRLEEKAELLKKNCIESKIPFDKRTATHGFYNGVEDLKSVPTIVKSSFIKKSVNGPGVKRLENLVTFASELEKKVDAILKAKNSDQATKLIASVYELIEELKSATAEVNSLKNVAQLRQCVQVIDELLKTVDIVAWEQESNNINSIGSDMNTYIAALSNIQSNVSEITTFQLGLKNIKVEEQIAFVSNYGRKQELLNELDGLKNQLSTINVPSVYEWAENSKVDVLVESLREWITTGQSRNLSECLQNNETLAIAKNYIANRTSLSTFMSLNPDNQNIVAANNLEKLMVEFSTEWKKLYSNPTTIQIIGDAQSLPNPFKTSHDLNAAVKMVIDLAAASGMQSDLESFEKFEKEILASFDKLPSAKKAESVALWNAEINLVKTLLNFIKQLSTKIFEMPKHLADYSSVFAEMGDFTGMSTQHVEELVEVCEESGSPYPTPKARANLKTLELDFANGNTVMKNGLAAFQLTLPLFADPVANEATSAPQQNKTSTEPPQEDSKEGLGLWPIAGISLGCVVVAGGVGGAGFYFYKKKKKTDKIDEKLVFIQDPSGDTKILYVSDKSLVTKMAIDPLYEEPFGRTVKDLKKEKAPAFKIVDKKEQLKNKHVSKRYKSVREICEKQVALQETYDPPKPEKVVHDAHVFPGISPADISLFQPIQENSEQVTQASTSNNHVSLQMESDMSTARSEKAPKPVDPAADLSEKIRKEINALGKVPSEEKTQTLEEASRLQGSGDKKNKKKKGMKKSREKTSTSVEKKKRKRLTPLQVAQLSYDQILKRGKAFERSSEEFDESEEQNRMRVEVENPNSNLFSDDVRKNDEVDVNTMISEMLGEGFISYVPKEVDRTVQCNHSNYHLRQSKFEKIISLAMDECHKDPAVLRLQRVEFLVVTDIHGRYHDFCHHLTSAFMDKHVTFVFCGDYLDRFDRSLDVLLFICLLKIAHPKRFYFLRGNHETPTVNMGYGFLDECRDAFGFHGGTKFWKHSNDLFKTLPVCGILKKKVFVVHGGICEQMGKENPEVFFSKVQKIPSTEEEALINLHFEWADPIVVFDSDSKNPVKFQVGKARGMPDVYNFTAAGVEYVSENCDFDVTIRGHQVLTEGFEFFAGNRVLTIYSSTNNMGRNKSAHVRIDKDCNIRIVRFHNETDPPGPVRDDKTERDPKPPKN
ncbi:hypothetical protein CRE_10974 [Caenorhabditis remanei]|uniref:Serine/threonine-protein phosphatase n=1 Tax=Caenorhabditis remanei TaxID=31234 RepID=E3M5T4_CAERE|nr:hypothetical protein CRE_10974 [Caenorhabditis remanei]